MRDLGVLRVDDAAVGLEVDVVEASQEGFLQHVVDGRVVEHGQQVVHGQDGLTQGLDEHVFSLGAHQT